MAREGLPPPYAGKAVARRFAHLLAPARRRPSRHGRDHLDACLRILDSWQYATERLSTPTADLPDEVVTLYAYPRRTA